MRFCRHAVVHDPPSAAASRANPPLRIRPMSCELEGASVQRLACLWAPSPYAAGRISPGHQAAPWDELAEGEK